MTASGRYASPDSSFGRSTSNAAARGGALIAVAVVIGFLLLWQGGVGGSDSATEAAPTDTTAPDDSNNDDAAAAEENDDDSTDSVDETNEDGDAEAVDGGTDGTEVEPTVTEAPVTLRPPNEVLAAVANGTDTGGLAGSRSGVLATAGYVTVAVNALNDTSVSNVFYVEGYGNEAEQVAILLGGDASVLRPATAADLTSLVAEANQPELDGYHILVVLGTDQVLG